MNLDDTASFVKLDGSNMLAEIDGLPAQLAAGWEIGARQPLPAWTGIRNVAISGMGGSAIGADLLEAIVSPQSPAPLAIVRDYDLPAWAAGPETLVIAVSHSGNTEETLSTFEQAVARGCRCLAVTTGGKLAQAAQQAGAPAWIFEHAGQPRAAVGYSFALLLAAFERLSLLPDPAQTTADLAEAVQAMQRLQVSLRAGVPAAENPAKRYAGQMVERWVTVIGAGVLAPVARRWKSQINELAKAWAQFEFLPEADHNTLAGILYPAEMLPRLLVMFLRAPSLHPRNQLRTELTRKGFMLEGLNTDFYEAQGRSPMAHMWTALLFGDYVAYYLAMAYGIDPTPVEAIEGLKLEMRKD